MLCSHVNAIRNMYMVEVLLYNAYTDKLNSGGHRCNRFNSKEGEDISQIKFKPAYLQIPPLRTLCFEKKECLKCILMYTNLPCLFP